MERAEPRTILRTPLLLAAALAVAGCSSLMPRSVEQPAADPQIPPA